ncbi:MAG: hypothetical protein ACRERE_22245 [Candidatus Entotheonellia bacterium]
MQVASTARHPVARLLYTGIAAKHLSPGAAMQAAAQIPYNYLRAKVEQLTDVMEEQATRLELLLGTREE